jgi:pyridoxamine 5'-phosphate oxidase
VHPENETSPWPVFEAWYQAAVDAELPLPEAMTLATVGMDGSPAARIVLYKGRAGEGLTFFTNYQSRKGTELERVPQCALVFHWAPLERQVRVEGHVEKIEPERSDLYFATRPRESQLGAWASAQSESLASREGHEERYRNLERRFAGAAVPRPPHWGGYRVIAQKFEFWMAHPGRLNERILFTRTDSGWMRTRLAP